MFVTIELASYWLWFDQGLHATNRYYMRTALVVVTPVLGVLAVTNAFTTERAAAFLQSPWLDDFLGAGSGRATTRIFCGLFFLTTLVYTVETIKFVAAWNNYKAAVRGARNGNSIRSRPWRSAISYPRPGSTQTSIGHPGTRRPPTCRCSWHQDFLQQGSWWIRLQTIFGCPAKWPQRTWMPIARFPRKVGSLCVFIHAYIANSSHMSSF